MKAVSYPRHPENNVTYTYGASNDASGFNRIGRLVYQEDGSGGQELKYGKMGEITELRRTLVIPNQAVATYVTGWTYDCWNRLINMTYPDGEILNYHYNTAGLLNDITGLKGSSLDTYVSSINYDKFEQRVGMHYGNQYNPGTATTTYTYNPLNRQLSNLQVLSNGKMIMKNAYTYDKVSNVTDIVNSAEKAVSGLGGATEHHYTYDKLYRLTGAWGDYADSYSKYATYQLNMTYDNMHNITGKKQAIFQTGVQFAGMLRTGYNLSYNYAGNQQQISNIADSTYRQDTNGSQIFKKQQQYNYDANGNLICVNTGTKTPDGKLQATNNRKLLWDEENRLLALSDNGFVSNYWYDAAGERTVKESGGNEGVSVNGVLSGARTETTNFTAYISPYMVLNNGGYYSKHIYIGSQRIVSKLGSSDIFAASPLTTAKAGSKDFTAKLADQTGKIKIRFDSLGVTYKGTPQSSDNLITSAAGIIHTPVEYFYHSDHLGSSSLITDASGEVVQHLEYIPFGEVFVDERHSTWNTPYKFNAKELDEETGLYYYGARYYDPKTSVWISVDPLAEKYPNVSPYVYCLNNPVKFVDPDGRKVYLFATTLPMGDGTTTSNSLTATHTFIVVTREGDKSPNYYAYGGTGALSGQLGKREYTQDEKVYTDYFTGKENSNLKNAIEVPVPDGMKSAEFDNKVMHTANSYGNNENVTYGITGLGKTTGNCNTSTSTILAKSGVNSETLSDIKSQIKGTSWGFGNIKPWTAQEQNEVSPQPKVTIPLKLDNSIPVAVKDNTRVVQ